MPTKWWRSGAIKRDSQGEWRRVDIPRLAAQSVDIFNVAVADGIGLGVERGLDAIFNVLPDEYPETDNIFALIIKGYRCNDFRDREVLARKLDALERFTNSGHTNADNLDCVSCHYAEARFPELAATRSADAFVNPDPARFDLRTVRVITGHGRVVRAFDYHDGKPVVSQRTINESAICADCLNRRGVGSTIRPDQHGVNVNGTVSTRVSVPP